MPLESSKTRRRATSFSALRVGTEMRKTSATTAGPDGQDFQNDAASFTRFDKGSVSVASPGAIAANTTVEVTVTLPDVQLNAALDGATQTDVILLNPPVALEAGLSVHSARVTALDTFVFRISNLTGVAITPATANYLYFLARS